VNEVEAAKEAAAPSLKRPKTQHKVPAASDGDLPPGVDGGSTDAEVPFFFRRQPVFYRSAHPVGSIIIDKQQHFLYLIRPNQVALRYGRAAHSRLSRRSCYRLYPLNAQVGMGN
jgi:hypothetical protein